MSLRTLTAIAAVAAMGIAALPAQADTTITRESKAFTASSLGATIAWSSYDASAKVYRLMTVTDGRPAALPVAPSKEPFDADLGTNRSGHPVAVYTRHGDIYRFNFASGKEEKLTKLSSHAEERQPTVWRGEIAFVRLEHGKQVLRIGNTTTGSKGTRAIVKLPNKLGTITDPQLSLKRIAYTVSGRQTDEWGSEALHVRTLRSGHERTIYEARSGGANFADITRPTWDATGAHLYFARTNLGAGAGNRYIRWTARTGRLAYARGTRLADSTSWLGARDGMLVSLSYGEGICEDGSAPPVCRLIQTGPLSFTARP